MILPKPILYAFIFKILIFNAYSQAYPGILIGGRENDSGYSLAIPPQGGFTLLGSTRSKGKGSEDFYLVHLDSCGQVVWELTKGKYRREIGYWIENVSGGGYILLGEGGNLVSGNQDFYMVRVDNSGREMWSKGFGKAMNERGFCVKPFLNGYIAAGYSDTTRTRGEFWVIRTDENGREIWRRSLGTEAKDHCFEVLPVEGGKAALFGDQGGFFSPVENDFQFPHSDLLLIMIDRNGKELWRKSYGGEAHELGRQIETAPDGGFYLLGSSQSCAAGNFDVYLVRTDAKGELVWERTFGGKNMEYGYSLSTGPEGELYLLGVSRSFSEAADPDIYLIKTDADGRELWSMTIGGPGSDYGYSLRTLPDSSLACLGVYEHKAEGQKDIILLNLGRKGEIRDFPCNEPGFGLKDISFFGGCTEKEDVRWVFYDRSGKVVRDLPYQASWKEFHPDSLEPGEYSWKIGAAGLTFLKGRFFIP